MADEAIEWIKLILETGCAVGAAYGFVVARDDWRQSQRWRKSEELEKIIDRFEADPKCKLACTVLDWSARRTTYDDKPLVVTSAVALEALALHDVDAVSKYSDEAALLRDALDGALAFLVRLDAALDRDFVETGHAKPYFSYWLERLVTFDRHEDEEGTQALRVARYVKRYSDAQALSHLCERFGISAPELGELARSTAAIERLPRAKSPAQPAPR